MVLFEVGFEGFPANIVEGNGSGLIFKVGALGDVVVEFFSHGLMQFVFHFVHVDLRVPDLDGLGDGDEPRCVSLYQLYMSSLELVLKTVLLNLSRTENIHFF